MPKLPLLLLLPLVACASSEVEENFEAGDRHFRMGQFHDAHRSYLNAAEEVDRPSDELLARTEEARFRSILQSAETRIHLNEINEALQLLDFAEAERPGYAEIPELRQHAYRRRAAKFVDEGEKLLDDAKAEEALVAYSEALRWDAENEQAIRGYEESKKIADDHFARGEEIYFEGLEQEGEGYPNRARTSFEHASHLHGDGSKAAKHLAALSIEVARVQHKVGGIHMEEGRIGAAWVALMDAVRLDPANESARTMLAEVNSRLEQIRLMNEAEMHVRGGRVDRADSLLERVLELTSGGNIERIQTLRNKAEYQRAMNNYRTARACELDQQIVRARDLYQEIMVQSGYGFEDVPLRIENLGARITIAADLYQKGLSAMKNGNSEAYLDLMGQVVEQAGDYEDALQRLEGKK
jgi:tetratricopeptide (TPR) repeat protein